MSQASVTCGVVFESMTYDKKGIFHVSCPLLQPRLFTKAPEVFYVWTTLAMFIGFNPKPSSSEGSTGSTPCTWVFTDFSTYGWADEEVKAFLQEGHMWGS